MLLSKQLPMEARTGMETEVFTAAAAAKLSAILVKKKKQEEANL